MRRNFFDRFKLLPWQPLLIVSSLSMFLGFALEILLRIGYITSPVLRDSLILLFSPPLGLIMSIAAAIGLGALAVVLLERIFPRVVINTGTLWALVLCLIVIMLLAAILPIPTPSSLVSLSSDFSLVGIVLGVFTKGRPYWR